MNAHNVGKSRVPASCGSNTIEHKSTEQNPKSARKVQGGSKGAYAKRDARYWQGRVKKDASKHFYVQIKFKGKRHRFTWKESNKEVAAIKAAALYSKIVDSGWDAVMHEYKPETAPKSATIGKLISEVEATTDFRRVTFTAYAQSLRQIAAEIAEIGDQPALDENGEPKRDKKKRIVYLSRRDLFHGGHAAWLAKVDALPLDKLDADTVQRWKTAYIAKAGTAPDVRRRAENTAASLIRNARSLFSENALKHAKAKLILPAPLPFAGVKLPKKGNTRYQSKIDAPALISAAIKEMDGTATPFQIFTLAMMCALRKREIDLLMWAQVDFTASQIRIERTEYFEPKSEESIGVVDVEPQLLALLRGWKARASGPFVIESARLPDAKKNPDAYRCEPQFKTLYAWLRGKGVTAQKPLHELRKECGALLASEQGIFAAKSVLRHAQISTTDAYYADKKRTITVGLGALFTASATNVTSADFTGSKAAAEAKPKRQRRA